MIREGTVVYRIADEYLTHINRAVLRDKYPPPGSICIVITGPKERDLADQLRATYPGHVSLKKAVDLLHEGQVYKNCEMRAFSEVKRNDRENL